jgi:hypothetical protein
MAMLELRPPDALPCQSYYVMVSQTVYPNDPQPQTSKTCAGNESKSVG